MQCRVRRVRSIVLIKNSLLRVLRASAVRSPILPQRSARSFADAIESRRIVPQDLSPRRLGQRGIFSEVPDRALRQLLRSVGMRIVGSHDEVVVADMFHEAADQLLAGLTADDALALPVGAR